MCKILPRLKEIADHEGITIGALERSIGASKGVISRAIANGTDIQSKWLQAVVEKYPHYSAQWLLTGMGEMIIFPASSVSTPIIQSSEYNDVHSRIKKFETGKRIPGAIPLVSERAVGGFSNEHFSINEHDVIAYYSSPKFRHLGVDFMIELTGDSMIPKFYPGDILACSIIYNRRYIEWNKPYLIGTKDSGLIVKRIRKSSDSNCLLAVSENSEYEPFDLPKDEILVLARVVGFIHIE